MRKLLLSLLFIIAAFASAFADSKSPSGKRKNGYKIDIKFTDVKDSTFYLVHYYGKPLPTIYRTDSAKLDKKGMAVLESDSVITGGIYMILLSDKSTYFEFLLDNGDEFSIMVDSAKTLPTGLKFKNAPENERFVSYVKYLVDYGAKQETLRKQYESAKTTADSNKAKDGFTKASAELKEYRKSYAEKYPNTLLANIFKALMVPEVPKEPKKLADGTVDSNYAYDYYRQHYWDDFNFQDDRLILTPIYDGRLEEYFERVIIPVPDTIQYEADKILAKAKGTKDMFKYTLWWLTRFTESSKVMGMDAAFVYLVENYYMKGDAYWVSPEDLQKYVDRAHKIAPNVLGNVAPELKMPGIDGKQYSLHGTKAKYTLLIFWSPECGHCLTEMPKVDSVYKAVLKDRGVKIFAVRTEGDTAKWREVINKNKMNDWIHVHDPERQTRFRAEYDIYSTPVLYLLDEKKIIRGKRMDHSNIVDIIDFVERQEKRDAEKKKS